MAAVNHKPRPMLTPSPPFELFNELDSTLHNVHQQTRLYADLIGKQTGRIELDAEALCAMLEYCAADLAAAQQAVTALRGAFRRVVREAHPVVFSFGDGVVFAQLLDRFTSNRKRDKTDAS